MCVSLCACGGSRFCFFLLFDLRFSCLYIKMLTYKNILTLLFCSAFLLFLCALFCFCSACVYGLFFFFFFGTPHAKAEESHILLTIKQNHGKRWRVKRAVQKIVISNCCCAIFFSSSSSQLPSSLSLLLIVLYYCYYHTLLLLLSLL